MMGSQFLSREEAMTRLKASRSTLYRHIRKGYLRVRKVGNTLEVLASDVDQFLKTQEQGLPFPVNQFTLASIIAEVRMLRKEVDTLMRLQNLRHEPLALTEAEFVMYHQTLQQYASKGWPPHAEEMLTSFFLKIKYEDFETMARVVKDPQPWKPAFRLVSTMVKAPFNKELLDELEKGKSNIEQLAQLWVEMHGGSEKRFDSMVKKDATPLKKLMKYLTRQQAPSPKSPH